MPNQRQPVLQLLALVVDDNHEKDSHSSSSSTCLPLSYVQTQRLDLSTVPAIPPVALVGHHFQLSPLRPVHGAST